MKLLNQSLKYLSVSVLLIVAVWALVFYVNLIREINDSIDDGLENFKNLIVENVQRDSTRLSGERFDQHLYSIKQVDKKVHASHKDIYKDTLIHIPDPDDRKADLEPVRMLTTTFSVRGIHYQLEVISSTVEKDELIEKLIRGVMWLFVILLLGIFLINNVVLRKLWKPFYEFLDQLKLYRLEKSNARELPRAETKTREFRDMQQTVNNLLKQSIATYQQQKNFIGNASHELQTPLAIVISKLELLLENENLPERQAEKIVEIYGMIERLIRLNKALLLLSKIDNRQFFENAQIAISEIVDRTLEELEDMIRFKGLTYEKSVEERMTIVMDPTLANIVIGNLLKNAVFHSPEGGKIEIAASGRTFGICNTAKGGSLEKDQIFERFQKSGAEAAGTGLGLAIAKAIADLYDVSISYKYESSMHCFALTFPAAVLPR